MTFSELNWRFRHHERHFGRDVPGFPRSAWPGRRISIPPHGARDVPAEQDDRPPAK